VNIRTRQQVVSFIATGIIGVSDWFVETEIGKESIVKPGWGVTHGDELSNADVKSEAYTVAAHLVMQHELNFGKFDEFLVD
jgi:hypothetical protein